MSVSRSEVSSVVVQTVQILPVRGRARTEVASRIPTSHSVGTMQPASFREER